MSGIPYIPGSAPFTPEQRAWLNGYLAGLFSNADTGGSPSPTAPAPATPGEPLLILYGSQSGTAEGVAKRIAQTAGEKGYAARVMESDAYDHGGLTGESRLVIVTSTWGDGDPPDNAVRFWSYLKAEQAPRLENLHFAVLALGDSSYAEFCGAGRNFDERLAALGARRICDRADCDVDFEASASAWIDGLWTRLGAVVPSRHEGAGPSQPVSPPAPALEAAVGPGGTATPAWSRKHPFPARLITNRILNGPGSAKDTRHFELSLTGSDLTYEAGDALGVFPMNCPELVEEIVQALHYDGEESVKDPQGNDTSLRTALTRHRVITRPPAALLQALAARSGDPTLAALLEPANKDRLNDWLWGREIIDLLLAWPQVQWAPEEFVGFLAKLQPRLYSISSSPRAHPGEVHLTVGSVRYECHGRSRKGVCSTFLADRVTLNESPVPVFVQKSHGFRLPSDPDRPVIMVGPGTGIAPFRAFLEERRASGAKGRNWLFFGDQRAACDFLYRDELETWQAEGVLTRLDLAFSRDQPEKIYVQTRMLAAAAELWNWLESGAHFYVCGDARRMAKDVDAALHRVIETEGGRTHGQAVEYVAQLKQDQRYQRDVY